MRGITISKQVDNTPQKIKNFLRFGITAASAAAAVLAGRRFASTRAGSGESRSLPAFWQQLPVSAENRFEHEAANQWDVPLMERPQLAFDKGQVLHMLEVAIPLQEDSPAAAIALLDFLTLQQHEYQPYARARLTTLFQRVYPHSLSLRSALAGDRESEQSNDGRLTTALSRHELAFMQHLYGVSTRHTTSLTQLAGELQQLTDQFRSRDSQRRQGAARLVLADINLRLGHQEEANRQMSRALVLIGTVHGSSGLLQAAVRFNGSQVIEESFGPSSGGAQKARDLAGETK